MNLEPHALEPHRSPRDARSHAAQQGERRLVPPQLCRLKLEPGPGIAPFWKGIAVLLGLRPKVPIADGPVSLTMMRHVALRRAALEITPWGVVTAVAHPWEDISQIVLENIQQAPGTNDRGWPNMKSFLYVDVAGMRFQSYCDLQPALDNLPTLARGFAVDAERLIALDLDGQEAIEPRAGGVFRRLAEAARAIARSEAGQAMYDVTSSDYRTHTKTLRDESIRPLRRMLTERCERTDRAPLAAMLAAEAGVDVLLPEILAATRSASPIAALVCRAAALRLGARERACGPGRSLDAFVEDGEALAADRWSGAAITDP